MSDVDEIPRADVVQETLKGMRYEQGALPNVVRALLRRPLVTRMLRHHLKRRHPCVTVFNLTPYSYFLNCVCVDRMFPATRMVYYRDLGRPCDLRRWNGHLVPNGGWHFTCMGGVQAVQEKSPRSRIRSIIHRSTPMPRVCKRRYFGASMLSRNQAARQLFALWTWTIRCPPTSSTILNALPIGLKYEIFRCAGVCCWRRGVDSPSFRFRVRQYLPYLQAQSIRVEIGDLAVSSQQRRKLLASSGEYDGVLVHRALLRTLDFWTLRRHARQYVFDVDDAIMFRDSGHRRMYSRQARMAF